MVCIGKRLENGVVVVCEKINDRCEHDELRDMKYFMLMRKKVFVLCEIMTHFFKLPISTR